MQERKAHYMGLHPQKLAAGFRNGVGLARLYPKTMVLLDEKVLLAQEEFTLRYPPSTSPNTPDQTDARTYHLTGQ